MNARLKNYTIIKDTTKGPRTGRVISRPKHNVGHLPPAVQAKNGMFQRWLKTEIGTLTML